MGRLIDEDLVKLTDFEIVMCEGDFKKAFRLLCEKLDSTPTVDAVEVIRCKECKHRFLEIIEGKKVFSCLYRMGTLDLDGYCEMGEKK